MRHTRSIRRRLGKGLILVVLSLVVVVALSPNASAAQYNYSPPWAQHTVFEHDATAMGVAWNYAVPGTAGSDGSIQPYSSSFAGPGWGFSGTNVEAIFAGVEFTPSISDYHTFYFFWKITGWARPCVYVVPPNAAAANSKIWITANVWDSAAQRWVYDKPDTVPTITLVNLNGNPLYCGYYPWRVTNQYYTLSFSYALYQGRTYYLYAYLNLHTAASALGISQANAYASIESGSSHWGESIYVYSPPQPCVASGTKILLPDGSTAKVDKLETGDYVMGYDLTGRQLVPVLVTANIQRNANQIVSVNDGLLKVTPTDQPIYVRNGTWEGWVMDASHLEVGEELFLPASGSWLTIDRIETLSGSFKVFDLRTDGPNNFIANGVLVLDKV